MSPLRATMMATGASITFLGISAMLLLTKADAEEKPAKPSQPSLIVTPSTSMAFSRPGVAFTNVSNGQGSTIRPAKLIVQASSPPRASGQIAPNRGGVLLDDHGGYLLDDRAGRLLAQ